MVPIDHVVVVVELVDVDRRQLIALDHCRVDPGPAVPEPAIGGEEARIEVGGLGLRDRGPDHLVEWDLPHATESLALQPRGFQHAVQ